MEQTPSPSTFQTIDQPPQLPPQTRPPRRVSMRVAIVVIALSIVVGWLAGTYGEGILWKPDYPVLSDPSKKPPTEVPALFSQSGTVTAKTATALTISYGQPTASITFPLTPSTPVFRLIKDTSSGKLILSESPATLSDITIGASVAVQIAERSLKAVAPLKIQILP